VPSPENINWVAPPTPLTPEPESSSAISPGKIFASMVLAVTGLLALLCALALPIWILGVPGVENEYARGWLMGLQVIIAYPMCWAATFAASRHHSRPIIKNKTRPCHGPFALLLMLGLFLAALARLWFAFQVMG